MKELIQIQSELKAPKNQRNSFGGYNYRSCEDILEAVKPLLAKNGCTLTITDAIEVVGDRIYVKATATVKNKEGESEAVSAFAREPAGRKGMDDAQVTGSSSSYARKYALNGLFCIDDNRDPDASNTQETQPRQPARPAAQAQPQKSELDVLTEAILKATNAQDRDALTAVWNEYKGRFGENPSFKKAVADRNRSFKEDKV